MKVIILGDLHFGVKSFSMEFLKYQINFFKNNLIPYMKKNNIDTILQLGDVLENRRTIEIEFNNYLINNFFNLLRDEKIKFITLLGNHDVVFNNTNEVTLMKLFSTIYNNITVIEKNKTIEIGNLKISIIPWIPKGQKLKNSDIPNDIVLGHFNINGFDIVKGIKETNGIKPSIFKDKLVFSGHFHRGSEYNNIIYVGTPYSLNWGDYKSNKRFVVLDTETKKYEFISNDLDIKYIKIGYDGLKKEILVKGIAKDKYYTINEFYDYMPNIIHHNIKFYINKDKDNSFEEIMYNINKYCTANNIKQSISIINNVELEDFIGTSLDKNVTFSKDLIYKTIEEEYPELKEILEELTELNEY